MNAPVLIVGAGPTGLNLALWLKRLDIPARIIDRATAPGTTSRALAVQARTMEFYRQLGIADDVLSRGLQFSGVNLWVHGDHAAHAELGDMGNGISPFPKPLIFPQDEHERLLIEHLASHGVGVERAVELLALAEERDAVRATLRFANGAEEERRFAYVVGCDGASSTVRHQLNIGFPGGTYDQLFYVADTEIDGPVANQQLHVAFGNQDFLAVFPLAGERRARLIGTVQRSATTGQAPLTWNDVSHDVIRELNVEVRQVNWFSTYHVHHRVADRFRSGRAFLAGDAAHIHSPVGGQGMNTGIGDAVNLAWKLARALRATTPAIAGSEMDGAAANNLLDTYDAERSAFARRLVASTDRAFSVVTGEGAIARAVRQQLAPLVLRPMLAQQSVRHLLFRTVSQTGIEYRDSSLSQGRVGEVHGGDRLPWIPPTSIGLPDNFTPLASLDWQLHVYGPPPGGVTEVAAVHRIQTEIFGWDETTERAGIPRGTAFLVRPDGYVGLAGATAESLERYVIAHRVAFRRLMAS